MRRSFDAADVNTAICLFSVPNEKRESGLDQTARFVMFKTPFEGVLDAVIFEEVEEQKNGTVQRNTASSQSRKEIFWKRAAMIPLPTQSIRVTSGVGSIFASPDIYWTILSKGKHLIRQLSTYFDGERYLNTGGADGFFIPTQVSKVGAGLSYIFNERTTTEDNAPFEGEIEEKYFRPLIKDYTKNNKHIEIHGYDTHCLLLQMNQAHAHKDI